ncbi:hypothetical protein DICPUDRAFT_74358 [Dictyostelium purpureum]|uniref:T4 RNA ligase 1-like N-terminal domain-containing protein n=1 Tax=Dictyostelium purpureum TaxID=5786 RepID=F0Z7I0_DICPU|nr:uncharacterized protein DICPUDRAFT_74358 [Dictyostelium purpureum]EGC40063.1 hypothetical protein DICPUDRAFT_74358 [Dictyostelium purpureum]|eukprot:XP_003283412.1 hypothetical protein DICPUDRAFT_74358 [Dictyostelium purpureum]
MDSSIIDYTLKNNTIFPVGITIEECREAIKDVGGFRESIRENTIVFNYDSIYDESFPDPVSETDPKKSYLLKVRRECRGLIFCKDTHKLLVRKLHKFFNINEKSECKADLIPLEGNYILMDKIDGSLISPMLLNNENSINGVYWGSKQGISDLGTMVNNFILSLESNQSNNIKYSEFSKKCLESGYSPLFEFTSPKQPIIIHYKEDRLQLNSPRDIKFEKDIWSLLLSGHYDDVKDTINWICPENEEPNDKVKRLESFSKELFERIDKVSAIMVKNIIKFKNSGNPKNQFYLTESSSGLNKKAFILSIQLYDTIQQNDSVQQHLSSASKFLIQKLKVNYTTSNLKLEEGRSILGNDIKF